MRPDFQIDIFWASSIRSKLAQSLSGVAVSGEISDLGWAHSFYMGDSHFVWKAATANQLWNAVMVKADMGGSISPESGIRTRAKD